MEAFYIDGWAIQNGVNGDADGRRTLASKTFGKSTAVIVEEGKDAYAAIKATTDFNGKVDEHTVYFTRFAAALHSCDEWLYREQIFRDK